MVLAGNVAIESMGGPTLGYAAGRMDNVDNSQTIFLGPSPEQHKFCPVGTDGDMKFPLGANTMGLIYVNPEGESKLLHILETSKKSLTNLSCSLSL